MKIIYKLFLFFILIFITDCHINAFRKGEIYKHIELKIIAEDTTVFENENPVEFKLFLINNEPQKIAILNFPIISEFLDPGHCWNIKIYYLDTLFMFSRENFVCDIFYPSSKDYLIIEPGRKYEMDFKIDFKTLFSDPRYFDKENKKFGRYTIKLIYHDVFLKHRNAIKNIIESNTLKITYLEND